MTARRLIVFGRLPELGRVKTRLAATVGDAVALDVHRRLLHATIALGDAAPVDERELRVTGDRDADTTAWLARLAAGGWRVCGQSAGDLGHRMHVALCDALAAGSRPVLVGTDCPVLAADDLARAFDALATHDAVFAPAEDGGYALVGTARPLPGAFDDIAWGTSRVMATTRARLVQAGARWLELRTVWDVDEARDLLRWQGYR